MSDIHVLEGNGNKWRVVMHIPIPVGDNEVNKSHRDALVATGRNTSEMPVGPGLGEITQAEMDQITAGAVFEEVRQFDIFGAGSTNAERTTALKAFYTQVKGDIFNKLEKGLRYYGYSANE